MASQPRRVLKTGMIIDRTVDVVSRNSMAALVYILALAAFTAVVVYVTATLLPPGDALTGINWQNVLFSFLLQIAVAIFTIIALYLLSETMLRSAGFPVSAGARRYLPFIGMSFIVSICSSLGLLVFIVPGLIFMARWSLSAPFFISGGKRAFDAMGESWSATRGSEFAIIGAILVLLVIFYGVSIGAGLARGNEASILLIAVSALAGSIGGVISTALGVAIYGLLPGDHQAAKAFE